MAALAAAAVALAGCGGGEAGPTGADLPGSLSYAPISGVWTGQISDPDAPDLGSFSVRLSLGDEAAPPGDSVGAVSYGEPVNCAGKLLALDVEGDVYEVTQITTEDPDNMCLEDSLQLRLTHDPAASTLFYESFDGGELFASGRLEHE